jgi:metallo-beta-lactamase class B
MMKRCRWAAFGASLVMSVALAAEPPQPDAKAVSTHLAKARALAWPDLYTTYVQRCITAQAYPQYVNDLQRKGPLPPTRVFDQLHFVGDNSVSAWAINTPDGMILFDALNGPEDVEGTIVPGLKRLGLDATRIRYIVLTHAHGDHYGGVNALKALSGARVVSTALDWQEIERQRTRMPEGLPPEWGKLAPERDMTVGDGDTLSLGGMQLRFYVTPGHTPGTLSTVFDVTDNGIPHRVALFGGLGLPRSETALRQYSASLDRFARLARDLKVDAIIANHQTQDDSRVKLEELKWRTVAPHPYVLGPAVVPRFFEVQAECGRVALARMGRLLTAPERLERSSPQERAAPAEQR